MEREANELEQKMSKILYLQLALENYEELTGNYLDYLNSNFEKLKELRENRKTWSEELKIEKADEIIECFNEAILKVGKKYFTFYDNGAVEYTGPNSFEEKKKEGK